MKKPQILGYLIVAILMSVAWMGLRVSTSEAVPLMAITDTPTPTDTPPPTPTNTPRPTNTPGPTPPPGPTNTPPPTPPVTLPQTGAADTLSLWLLAIAFALLVIAARFVRRLAR